MASFVYDSVLSDLFASDLHFNVANFRLMLVTDKYRAEKAVHRRRSDVTDEVKGSGYSAGGSVVETAITPTQSPGLFTITLGGAFWINSTIRARAGVYYKANGGRASDDELIAYIDFDEDVISTNGTFQLTESALQVWN